MHDSCSLPCIYLAQEKIVDRLNIPSLPIILNLCNFKHLKLKEIHFDKLSDKFKKKSNVEIFLVLKIFYSHFHYMKKPILIDEGYNVIKIICNS